MCDDCVHRYMEDEDLETLVVPESLYPLVSKIRAFYEMDGCQVGGPLHIVLDDTNVEDDHIQWCLAEDGGRNLIDSITRVCYSDYTDDVWAEAEGIAAELLAIESLAMRAAVTRTVL